MTTNSVERRHSGIHESSTNASVESCRDSARRLALFCSAFLMLLFGGCSEGGGGLADNGGMSGTGVSQGSISSFGSIFVNGVRWDVSGATIEIDGTAASEADLRVGMVVRVDGDFASGNTTGTATMVRFEDVLEGPIENAPVETVPGQVRVFSILGQSVTLDSVSTAFDDGATFDGLVMDDVLEVSGFVDAAGGIQATRVSLRGTFPADNDVDRFGDVANLVANPNGTGVFDLGTLTIRYTASTTFTDVTRATLNSGDRVKVEGTLRLSGDEIDADEIELVSEGLGSGDLTRVEVEGIALACPQSPEYCVGGVPIDTSMAIFEPVGFMPMVGDEVEVEGPLIAGTLVAERVESEGEDPAQRNVRIEAAVTSVDSAVRTLLILGVTVVADGDTTIQDKSSIDDENFLFGEILPGDFLEIRGIDEGGTVRALSIEREDATAGSDDVRFEGPVTALDTATPAISILGQPVPLDVGTLYFDDLGASRTEEEFFRNPGDVMIGDVVRAEDLSASNLSTLLETDEMEIEDPI
jgi:Domain of unknown function (DUF5666)